MKKIEMTETYQASADEVFNSLDDLSIAGMHMTNTSMPMMGGKMNLEFLTLARKGLHTSYRWTGKVLWMLLDFTIVVTRWIKGREKTWETVTPAKMIIYAWFRMDLKVMESNHQSTAHLSISYEKPKETINRILSFLFADWYCRWCLKNMLNDAANKLRNEGNKTMKIV